jgi:hypothetical protein
MLFDATELFLVHIAEDVILKPTTLFYEEWHLLGYKIKVRTPQKTHYVSVTESSQLMLCKI